MAAKRPDKIELYTVKVKGKKRYQWRWRRVAPNGEIVHASSESYVRRKQCLANARRSFVPCPIVIAEEAVK